MMQLLTMLPDAFVGGCAKWMIKLISSSGTEMNPAGTCRHCNAIIGLNNFICPACSCSYPFIDLSNMEQREDITRSVRMLWQEIPNDSGTVVGFGHPHRVPPNNHVLQIKSLTRMKRRLNQLKSYLTFNGGRPWPSYAESTFASPAAPSLIISTRDNTVSRLGIGSKPKSSWSRTHR